MKSLVSGKDIPYFSSLVRLAKKRNTGVWLVGGYLRDRLLGQKNSDDFDFCVEKNTASLAREFARRIHCRCIVLDKSQASFRVVLKQRKKIYTYDFTRMRGRGLFEDLALRDFSINTLAFDLRQKHPVLIDNFGARRDLKRKIIRVIQEKVIPDDPLRILRGFAFAAGRGFKIEPRTLKLMVKYKQLIRNVSRERVSEELFKIFSSPGSCQTFKVLDKFRIIDQFIPDVNKARGVFQGDYHHLDVWNHSLETLRQLEIFFRRAAAKNSEVVPYLEEEVASGHSRLQVIKLACLLHDIGKPAAKKKLNKKTIFHTHEKIGAHLAGNIATALRLSAREKETLKKLIFWHLRPGYLAGLEVPSQRAIYRFFRDTQKEGVGVILLSLADWRATRGPRIDAVQRKKHEKVMLRLVKLYFAEQKKHPLPKIIDGYDLMKKFKLTSGPLIGEILKKIREEQALGKIQTQKAAFRSAQNTINKALGLPKQRKTGLGG